MTEDSRNPPHNIELEQAVLGLILTEPKFIENIRGVLNPQHFALREHATIYEACLFLADSSRAVSPVTLIDHLGNDVVLSIGGPKYLMDLAVSSAVPMFALDYARSIADLSVRRDLIGLSEDMANGAFDQAEPDRQIAEAISKLEALAKQCGGDGLRTVEDFQGDVVSLYEGRSKTAHSTGYRSLDRHYKIRSGELSVVTGWPGSGKSQFVDHICINLAKRFEWRFAVCSFENSPDEHIGKLAEAYIGLPFHDGPSPRMSRDDLNRAMAWVHAHFVFIRSDKESPTIDWALSRAAIACRDQGINGLILDPYNEFEHVRGKDVTETQYIAAMLSRVKRYAANYQNHVWFIAHPQKPPFQSGDEAPTLLNISGGAHWANKADCGISVHRPFEGDKRSRTVEIHVKKVRFRAVGEPGMAKLEYIPSQGAYREVGEDRRSGWRGDE